jgi:purine-binding chemotaxis protein CheW
MDEMNTTARTGQYLSFLLDGESFAIEVAQIREIVDRANITRIPRMPAFLKGVTNLRGSVVPVVDMRVKFDMGVVEETLDSCIIVLEVNVDTDRTVVGAYVDAVQEVFEIGEEDMEPAPRMGTRLDTTFIEGMARRGEEFAIVLDVDSVFSAEEICAVHSAAAAGDDGQPEGVAASGDQSA